MQIALIKLIINIAVIREKIMNKIQALALADLCSS